MTPALVSELSAAVWVEGNTVNRLNGWSLSVGLLALQDRRMTELVCADHIHLLPPACMRALPNATTHTDDTYYAFHRSSSSLHVCVS